MVDAAGCLSSGIVRFMNEPSHAVNLINSESSPTAQTTLDATPSKFSTCMATTRVSRLSINLRRFGGEVQYSTDRFGEGIRAMRKI